MTLNDYVNGSHAPVLFWTSVGTPRGDYVPLGYPEIDFAERRGLLELNGTVDAGDWFWDADGNPTDDHGNSILKLHAYTREPHWRAMVNDYEEDVSEPPPMTRTETFLELTASAARESARAFFRQILAVARLFGGRSWGRES